MKKVITAQELEKHLKAGGNPDALVSGAILTPSAQDLLKSHRNGSASPAASASKPAAGAAPIVPDYEYKWTPGTDAKTPAEIEAFFNSPEIQTLKQRMVDIGRRIWEKDYVDGNGGNLTIRVGDNLVLCTPTLISKGYMTADDMCLVDMDGKQLAGTRKRTSECMTHLAIMKRQPKAKACCHAHPPHATAFAVAGVRPPTCMIPEAEVFLGEIGMAEYQTPGTPENAKVVGDAAVEHMSVLMENHGVITWGKDIEDAYWKMENTDAYCKTVWISTQLGVQPKTITKSQAKELIGLRKTLGMDDKRSEWKECELCNNDEFRPGVVCAVPAPANAPAADHGSNEQAEAVVREVTDMILKQLQANS